MSDRQGTLHSLERNRFFYGKAMDVRQWRMEQSYGIDARALLARLGVGVGVLSGLGCELAEDGSSVLIRAGVAIDALGRTIVVPHDITLRDPQQPTDCKGKPEGDPVTDGTVTLELCYHECLIEPVSATACGCDTVERCEPGVICERYRLRLRREPPSDATPVACPAMFPSQPPDGFDRRRAIWDTLAAQPIPPARVADGSDCCVVLATFALAPNAAPVMDDFTPRQTIYSNQALFELLLCLAARVDECCAKHDQLSPPRVMRTWPEDHEAIAEGDVRARDQWLKQPRLEVAFERPIADSVLDNPEGWLRVWSFVPRGDEIVARRVELRREVAGLPPVLGDIGDQQVARYRLDNAYRRELQAARLLVQIRPGTVAAPIVVDGSTPPLLLDGEHHGTALNRKALETLWDSVTGSRAVPQSWWEALVAGTPPPLPSGEGHEGGPFDASFSFARAEEPDVTPRLLAFWPPNAEYLRGHNDDEALRKWAIDFREVPHLELTFDSTLDVTQFDNVPVAGWIRMWWLQPRDPGIPARRLELVWSGEWANPHVNVAGTTVGLRIENLPFDELQSDVANRFVWIMRADNVAVDADFNGVVIDGQPMDSAAIDAMWQKDQWPAGNVTPPTTPAGDMFDGAPGGTVVAYFDYAERA